jgi:UDP-galactopyranose mutase
VSARADVVILGGGLAGLSAAARLRERGVDDVVILEREARVGGLLKTHAGEQSVIDHLPHVFFSRHEEVSALFHELVGDVWSHQHRLGVRWGAGFVDFPFQNHVYQLPAAARREALMGLLERRQGEAGPAADLEAHALRHLGRGITELFFRPYNEKLWQTPLQGLDHAWLGAKIRLPDARGWAEAVLGPEEARPRAEVAPHGRFVYPKVGGIEALARGLLARIGGERVWTGATVEGVDCASATVRTTRGDVRYERLLSTLPLNRMLSLAGSPRGGRASARLRATRVVAVQLVLDQVELPDYHWIYVPDPTAPYYRLTRVDRINPGAAGDRKALIAEVALPEQRAVDPGALVSHVCDHLTRDGVAPRGAIREARAFDYEPAYPIPHAGGAADRALARRLLRERGIVVAGRFGRWEFQNMDHCMLSGFRAAEDILGS